MVCIGVLLAETLAACVALEKVADRVRVQRLVVPGADALYVHRNLPNKSLHVTTVYADC